ncbi:SRPBCC family protein [Georgenia sp. Z1344]|uniref:SRPBCC family protein n=1 Tax=Georgenia sp. Z1344 TaxID=3416706 RepID=UPI003CFB1F9E
MAIPVAVVAGAVLTGTGLVGAREVRAERWVDASPQEVWEVLTRPDRTGDPFLVRLDGELVEGATLGITVQPVDGDAMDFSPVVLEVSPGEELRWRGTFGVRGIVDGVHVWELEEVDGGTQIVQSERFTGVAVPFLGGMLDGTQAGFEAQLEWVAEQVGSD